MPDVYARLRERLDMFPQGFPQTKSGVELKILEHLFRPEEAEIAASLRPFPEPVATIAQRTGWDETRLRDTLYDMSKRGLILRFRESADTDYYFLTAWMVGIWEFQVNNLTQENIRLYERYYEEGLVPLNRDKKVGGLRVVPVEKELEGNPAIQPYEKVSAVIDSHSRFAVADCICRKEAAMLGKGCDKPTETCMTFGFAADYYIENEIGREITKEEARAILLKAEEGGLVHFTTNHADDKVFLCNCCGCCCKALVNITRYDNPGIIARSDYYATVDADSCDGCETRTHRCQVNAIRFDNGLAAVDEAHCIGCGLCASGCPNESIGMIRRQPEARSQIYGNELELLQARAEETDRPFPFE